MQLNNTDPTFASNSVKQKGSPFSSQITGSRNWLTTPHAVLLADAFDGSTAPSQTFSGHKISIASRSDHSPHGFDISRELSRIFSGICPTSAQNTYRVCPRTYTAAWRIPRLNGARVIPQLSPEPGCKTRPFCTLTICIFIFQPLYRDATHIRSCGSFGKQGHTRNSCTAMNSYNTGNTGNPRRLTGRPKQRAAELTPIIIKKAKGDFFDSPQCEPTLTRTDTRSQ